MKKIIIALAMITFGVQGYAQRYYAPRPVHHAPVRYHHPYRPVVMPRYYVYNPLGYYTYAALNTFWWGSSWDAPTKIKVDCITFKRTSDGRLKVKNGGEKKFYVDTYKVNSFAYKCPSGIRVAVETGGGEARISVYSADGQTTANYTL